MPQALRSDELLDLADPSNHERTKKWVYFFCVMRRFTQGLRTALQVAGLDITKAIFETCESQKDLSFELIYEVPNR